MSADLDPEKQAALLKFRERVSGILHLMKNDFYRSDDMLLKFLAVRGYSVDKAEEMFRKTVEWRQANNINSILERPFYHELDPCYEVLLPGFDKLGHPIIIIQAARIDLLGMLDPRAKTEVPTIFLQFIEKLIELNRMRSQNGKLVTKSLLIVDYAHYKLLANTKAITASLSMLRENCQVTFNNYPNCLYKFVVINATQVFQIAWAVVKPLLPKAYLDKIRIHGNNKEKWKNYLLEHIDPDVLPSQYGGANTTGLFDCRLEVDKDFIPRSDLELFPPGELLECYIEPRKRFSIDVAALPGDNIVWNFITETHDIEFKVECDDGRVIIEQSKVDSHKLTQKGRLYCPNKAEYTFTWDNAHSYMTRKKLLYAVMIRKGEMLQV